ncbi:hypothetical protein [Heyndrickxia oleronia]|uniref:hypothetical protein n=1 Tax=Heyndrickxia oleronia TaxID=38875 RepID=UPI003F523001
MFFHKRVRLAEEGNLGDRKEIFLKPIQKKRIDHIGNTVIADRITKSILNLTETRIMREIEWFVSPFFQPDERAETLFRQFIVSGMKCVPCIRIVPTVFADEELQNLTVETFLLVAEHETIYNPTKNA